MRLSILNSPARRQPAWIAGVSMLLLLALWATTLPAPRAAAAQSALTVARVGWGGHVIGETWAPVHLRLNPAADDPNAAVEVAIQARLQASTSGPTYPIAA